MPLASPEKESYHFANASIKLLTLTFLRTPTIEICGTLGVDLLVVPISGDAKRCKKKANKEKG